MDLLNELNGFTFEIEFNEYNLNRFNFTKKIKPLTKEFDNIEKTNEIKEVEKFIIDKIKSKIELELNDEKDLLLIYSSKIKKLINKLKDDNLNKNSKEDIKNKIKEIIETPLEGEIAKHNKIKVVTIKIIKENLSEKYDVLFYTKYKQIEGYNKQINKLYDSF